MSADNKNRIFHEKISADFERTIAHLENLMVVIGDFCNGPMSQPEQPHSHPHEQITYVAEGELLFHNGDQILHLSQGDLITIESNVPHCIQTLSSRVRLIDSFTPVREDYLK
jgi:mannose-6-phosphate isomerase-like protein (cupin superfamily)